MRASERKLLESGVLGRFWLLSNETPMRGKLKEKDAVRGQLQLVDGVVQIKTQADSPTTIEELHASFTTLTAGAEPSPDWIFGLTEIGSVIMPIVTGRNHRRQFGGTRISLGTYRGPAIAVSVQEPFGPRVRQLSVHLPHATWADLNPMTTTLIKEQPRGLGIDISLRNTELLDCGAVGSFALALTGTWSQSEDEHGKRTSITTGMSLTTVSKSPRKMRGHVQLAMSVQDLLSLAYDEFVPSYNAQVLLEGDPGDNPRTWCYHDELVQSPFLRGRAKPDEERLPLFSLNDIGGATSIARWVNLNLRYPDAANAIRVRNRAPTSPTRRVIELGAAIEQYVSSCKRQARQRGTQAKWTTTNRRRPPEVALAEHAGTDFNAFVGDAKRWGRAFNDAYVNEKHLIGDRRSAADLTALSSSAQLLLIVTFLNRTSRSKHPGRVLLADHRVTPLSERIQQLL